MNLNDVVRKDGWINVITGLNQAGRDKKMAAIPVPLQLAQKELDDLLRVDDVAKKIVNRIPYEFFRTGYEIIVKENDKAALALQEYMTRLKADSKFEQAAKKARHYGGSAVVLGIDDGLPAYMPVAMQKIRSIRWATVLDRYQLVQREIETDIASPDYGLPTLYEIHSRHRLQNNDRSLIHASRIIRFDGDEAPEQAFISNGYWHDSVLLAVYPHLRNFNAAHDGTASILQDFNQTVFELEGLAELLASGDDALIMKRLSLIDATRSIVRAIVIQKGENFRRDSANLAGLPETVRLLSNRLVAASDMPHTIILGEGSQGNTSGRSEETDFFNTVAQLQESYLKPRQLRLLELICAAQDSPGVSIADVTIDYKPLFEMDQLEHSQIYKTNAEADKLYIEAGVVDPLEVAQSRFGNPDAELTIDLALRESMNTPAEGLEGEAMGMPGGDATIQDLAMNGAQVSSLLEIISAVTSGSLPAASASAIIRAAFPAVSEDTVQKILQPLEQRPVTSVTLPTAESGGTEA